jgi:two-component sensor histidine kinase
MLQDALGLADQGIKSRVEGEVGELPAGVATPLSLVITELVQNAAEHAFASGGSILVELDRDETSLRAVVTDDGIGLPGDFTWEGAGLGLQIVKRLVTEELGGEISLHTDAGTRVEIQVPLPEYRGERRSAAQNE